jgi:rfaE bifunctional protein kinase chain/domain
MTESRFREITANYPRLRIAVVGDYCLDRYLEIDPSLEEISIETNLAVHNITNIRSQPGGAGTILNNLAALGIGQLFAVGFCGNDGEGYELWKALQQLPGVELDHFQQSDSRRTFTYTKPLICAPGAAPKELNRLDIKNWTPTPAALEDAFIASVRKVTSEVDAIIVLDQVDEADTGVVTKRVRDAIGDVASQHSTTPIFADSRRGLRDWPPVIYKMNARELAAFGGKESAPERQIRDLVSKTRQPVFVTLAERGMLGASPDGVVHHQPAVPIRGPIDIVGAGDSVMANLAAAVAAQSTIPEALELASAAASIVVHQLGTTGSASVAQLQRLLLPTTPQET